MVLSVDMITRHSLITGNSADLSALPDESAELVVTSPPYPMISMWDTVFSEQDAKVKSALERGDGDSAFEVCHIILDTVWRECFRILKDGSFLCINIGDAVRKIGEDFRLYPNHSRIISSLGRLGFHILPAVLWRKQTNSPTKFMGSGMYPAGAYVTLEHEYILISRKGGKKKFSAEDKERRWRSAFFWEERNVWFSDIWDFKGTGQRLPGGKSRERSAAFPLELPFRLICMYSLYGDTVVDPFSGTGTTSLAAAAAGRNSVGIDAAEELILDSREALSGSADILNDRTAERMENHFAFIEEREAKGKPVKYRNSPHDMPVMTKQEEQLKLYRISGLPEITPEEIRFRYSPYRKTQPELF
jgi:DNA modification methylase